MVVVTAGALVPLLAGARDRRDAGLASPPPASPRGEHDDPRRPRHRRRTRNPTTRASYASRQRGEPADPVRVRRLLVRVPGRARLHRVRPPRDQPRARAADSRRRAGTDAGACESAGTAPTRRGGRSARDPVPGDHLHAHQELARHHARARGRHRREADPGREPQARQRRRRPRPRRTRTAPASAPVTSTALEIGNEPELYKVFPWYEERGVPFYARPPIYDFTRYAADRPRPPSECRASPSPGPATGSRAWLARVPQLFRRRASAEGRHLPPLSADQLLLTAGRRPLPVDPEPAQHRLRP